MWWFAECGPGSVGTARLVTQDDLDPAFSITLREKKTWTLGGEVAVVRIVSGADGPKATCSASVSSRVRANGARCGQFAAP